MFKAVMWRRPRASKLVTAVLAGLVFSQPLQAESAEPAPTPAHGMAMHGDLKYPAGFKHFDYVNPQAPKGGTLRQSVIANGFDSFNPFILKGVAAAGVSTHLYDTLTVKSADEPFSEYGLIAESVELPENRRWVVFNLHPKARFSDGKSITADDVAFSFNILRDKGHPFFKAYYADVANIQVESPSRIRFEFADTQNRELPLIIGQLPILPAHYWKDRDFTQTTLEPPVGSGPYRIASFEAGRSITYERVADYWAADLPVNRGRYNIDKLVYDYYLDQTVALEAFKAGKFDFNLESTAKTWATAYTGERFSSGQIVKEEIVHQMPVGMQSFAFNTRRAVFADRRVREALAYAFDFEWTNRQLFHNQYTRTRSFFQNSDLASSDLPSGEELALLEPFRDKLPADVFTHPYTPPVTDGSGNLRSNLRTALQLLKEAGWEIKDGALTHTQSGQPLRFEILLRQKEFERVVLPFVQNLERLGVKASIRLVDSTQYVERVRAFDFDMMVHSIGQSESPGNEQRDFWHSANADVAGSRNVIGIKDPVVDALIDKVIQAPDRQSLVHRTRALDRVLLWGHYVIPQWHLSKQRIAYWAHLQRPTQVPRSGVDLDTWWVKP